MADETPTPKVKWYQKGIIKVIIILFILIFVIWLITDTNGKITKTTNKDTSSSTSITWLFIILAVGVFIFFFARKNKVQRFKSYQEMIIAVVEHHYKFTNELLDYTTATVTERYTGANSYTVFFPKHIKCFSFDPQRPTGSEIFEVQIKEEYDLSKENQDSVLGLFYNKERIKEQLKEENLRKLGLEATK